MLHELVRIDTANDLCREVTAKIICKKASAQLILVTCPVWQSDQPYLVNQKKNQAVVATSRVVYWSAGISNSVKNFAGHIYCRALSHFDEMTSN